jgi:hypothetical protein
VTTGDDSLVGSVDAIVVPYDDGELFSLHGGSFSWGLRPVWLSSDPQSDCVKHARAENREQHVSN